MRIGIDGTCWANERGYGRFTRELVGAMPALAPDDEFVCVLDRRAADRFALAAPNVRSVVVHQRVAPTLAASSGTSRSPVDMLRLTAAVRREKLDAFLSPSVYGYFPLPPGLPAVVAVHDAIAERFPALTLPSGRDRLFWALKVRLALRQASLVLTVSEYARDEITRHLGIDPADVRVTLEGVSAEYHPSRDEAAIRRAAARVGLPPGARWLMYVGGFNPHKRVDLLVRAHAAVAARRPSPPLALVLAGAHEEGFHQDLAGIRAAVAEGGAADLVKWPGYLDDAELRLLHSGAVALVLPSESEGFGLPAVEAASCGAPVIATTASPLPQILDGGGIFVPPGDVAALEQAIGRLAMHEDERQALGRRALDRAGLLSWSKSAKVALDALYEVAPRSRGALRPADQTTDRRERSFATRLAALLAGELVNKGSVIVAFVWLARTLDPAVYGEVEWALSLLMVFTLVVDAGLSTWGAAEVAARPGDAAALVRRIGTLRLALAVPAYLVLLAIAAAYGGRAGAALAVYGLVLFITPLFLQYLFNGLFQTKWAALGNALRGLTFAAVVLLVVREGSPPWMVAAAEVAGAAVLALCSYLLLGRVLGRHGVGSHFDPAFPEMTPDPVSARVPARAAPDLRPILARSWTIGASEVTWGVHWFAGPILLGYLATSTDAAWHSAALRLVLALHTGVWLYLYVLLPALARVITADVAGWRRTIERSLRLTGWAGWAVAMVGTLGADTILTTILGPPFSAAAPALQAAIWVVPVAWMSGHVRYSLIAAGRPALDYRAGLIGAGTTILLSLALIPWLRSAGTGLALLGGTLANAAAARAFARGVLPPFALGASAMPGVTWGLGCLILGLVLRPVTGEVAAAGLAAAALAAVVLVVERETAWQVVGALTGSTRLKVGNADARS